MGDTSGLYLNYEAAKEYFANKDYLNAAIAAHWCKMYCIHGEPYGIGDIKPYEDAVSRIYYNSVKKLNSSVMSKSTFILGSQCVKSLWLHRNKYKERKVSAETQSKFDRGHLIGQLAQHLFHNGIDASEIPFSECVIDMTRLSLPFNLKQHLWIDKTRMALEKDNPIYEAAFIYDGVFAAVDILTRKGDGVVAYEVKSSSDITDTYILDNALQYYVISNNLKITDFVLVHINEEYIQGLNIPLNQLNFENCDINQLFIKTSVIERILPLQDKVKSDIANFKKVLKGKEPKVEIGQHCTSPYECAFIEYCKKRAGYSDIFDHDW